MALIDATAFKVQTAAMATAITAAWKDSVKTEVASDIRNPAHPLRRIEKFFNFDKATGVVTSDDDYIDACYAGNTPSKGNGLDSITDVAMTLSSATVEDAAATDIVLTFAENIYSTNSITLGGDAAPAKEIQSVSISGAVVTVTVNTAYVLGNTITISGSFNGFELNSILLTDEAVTNNVT